MLAYERLNGNSECRQQSLAEHFSDKTKSDETGTDEKNVQKEKSSKQKAKEHLTKFLDVTRSDMRFADKVIADYIQDTALFTSMAADKKLSASSKITNTHILPIKKYIWSVVKKLTHDEILYFGYRILEQNHTALYATRVRFPFIFVDEFQDTSPV
jgi:ATP-dependent exoDNAse (exonuclease V) beta subunit